MYTIYFISTYFSYTHNSPPKSMYLGLMFGLMFTLVLVNCVHCLMCSLMWDNIIMLNNKIICLYVDRVVSKLGRPINIMACVAMCMYCTGRM